MYQVKSEENLKNCLPDTYWVKCDIIQGNCTVMVRSSIYGISATVIELLSCHRKKTIEALAFLCIADNCRCKTMQTNTRISIELFLLVGRLEIVTDKLRTICGDFDCIIWVYIKYRIYTIRIFTFFVFSFSSHQYSESTSKQFLTSVLDSSTSTSEESEF